MWFKRVAIFFGSGLLVSVMAGCGAGITSTISPDQQACTQYGKAIGSALKQIASSPITSIQAAEGTIQSLLDASNTSPRMTAMLKTQLADMNLMDKDYQTMTADSASLAATQAAGIQWSKDSSALTKACGTLNGKMDASLTGS